MNSNILPSNRVSVEAVISPVSQSVGSVSTPWLPMSVLANFLFMLTVGAMGTGATIDALLEQATDDAGAGSKPVDGKAIAQLTEAASNSDSQALINVGESDLDVENGFGYVRLTVSVGTASCLLAVLALGFDPNDFPREHAGTVAETV